MFYRFTTHRISTSQMGTKSGDAVRMTRHSLAPRQSQSTGGGGGGAMRGRVGCWMHAAVGHVLLERSLRIHEVM